ncbi:MAG: prepilin-type N-terminal cleavage/methylation domain-containing protein [Anaerococcus sp.]|nr:prepilin-type N-terminal cleavage/methylation domain-containing protein [Peptoniphilaceae bacterium]MDY2918645.1 prepilin-type N-terminal cleavage/methylation domain-containing protein [Anaerococcus sp.]
MIKKKRKGFTLIELVIVIAIIAILVAIAIPRYQATRKRAAVTAHNSNVQMLKSAGVMALSENEKLTKDAVEKYVEKWPEVPKGIGHDGAKYEVTSDGDNIVVTPGEIETGEETSTENNG